MAPVDLDLQTAFLAVWLASKTRPSTRTPVVDRSRTRTHLQLYPYPIHPPQPSPQHHPRSDRRPHHHCYSDQSPPPKPCPLATFHPSHEPSISRSISRFSSPFHTWMLAPDTEILTSNSPPVRCCLPRLCVASLICSAVRPVLESASRPPPGALLPPQGRNRLDSRYSIDWQARVSCRRIA